MLTSQEVEHLKDCLSPDACTKVTVRSQFNRLWLKRRVLEFFLVALLQGGGLFYGPLHDGWSLFWPGEGVALAILFFRGPYGIIGLFAGTFLAFWINQNNVLLGVYFAGIHTLQSGLIFFLTLRLLGPIAPVYEPKKLVGFFSLCLIVGLFTGCAYAYGIEIFSSLSHLPVSTLFFGPINGFILFTPMCLLFDAWYPRDRAVLKPTKMSTLIFGLLVFLFILFFWIPLPFRLSLAVAVFLVMSGMSYRYAQLGAVSSILTFSLFFFIICLWERNIGQLGFQNFLIQALVSLGVICIWLLATFRQKKIYEDKVMTSPLKLRRLL